MNRLKLKETMNQIHMKEEMQKEINGPQQG